jgi:hypothetical protein
MRARTRKIVITLGIAGAALGVTAGPAMGAPSGEASGVEGGLQTPIDDVDVPAVPFVALPPGGDESVLGISVPGFIDTGLLSVGSNADGSDGVISESTVLGASALPGVADLSADVISSVCNADPAGASGGSGVVDGEAAGTPLAASADPNTQVAVPGVGVVILNEQTTEGEQLTVRAVHVLVDTPGGITSDLALATVVCSAGTGVGGGDIPEAGPASPTSSNPSLAG